MAERGSRRRVRARAISEASEALWLPSARGRRAGTLTALAAAGSRSAGASCSCPRPVQLSPAPAPPRKPVPCGVGKEPCPQEPLWKERLQPGVIYGTKGRCRFFLSPRSRAEDTVVRSCSGDAVVCTRLGLAWVVSARPGSPRSTGAKRERRSGSWLWPGAAVAAAGEAGEREGRRDRRLSGRQLPLHVRKDPSSKCAAGPTVNVHRRVEDSRATGATEEEGRTEGERSVLPGERSEQRHERELRWDGFYKEAGSASIGCSPGFEFGLYTSCFIARPGRACHLSLGGLQPQHPDLQLDQVHLRQRQEVHRRRLRDLALSLGGRGRLQPRSRGRGLVLLWEADGCAAGAGPGARGSRAGRRLRPRAGVRR
ncbi:uncharacterized protein O3Q21_002098 [Podargus strigoides]